MLWSDVKEKPSSDITTGDLSSPGMPSRSETYKAAGYVIKPEAEKRQKRAIINIKQEYLGIDKFKEFACSLLTFIINNGLVKIGQYKNRKFP